MSDILKIKDKATGLWQTITAIKGDKGDTGDTGPQGPQGIQGEEGPQGPKGEQGDDYVLTAQDKQDIADLVKSEFVDGNSISY